MDFTNIKNHIQAYKEHDQLFDAAAFIVRTFGLEHDNFSHFEFLENSSPTSLILIADGPIGGKQKVGIPRNLFDFDITLVVNLLMHEMFHVKQKAPENTIWDKNEREVQAYTEMLFHREFPLVPDSPLFNQKQFAEKALVYYNRMEEDSTLKRKYAPLMEEVQAKLEQIEKQLVERKKNTNGN